MDVIVTDESGRFVADLEAADFRVFEDGREVEVAEAHVVDLRDSSVRQLESLGPSDVVPTTLEGNPAEGNPGDVAGRQNTGLGAMVFVIDGATLSPQTKLRFAEVWRRTLDEDPALSIGRAVYYVDSVGRLREITPITTDPDELRSAAETVAALPSTTTQRTARLLELARDLSMGVSEEERDYYRSVASSKSRQFEAEARARSIASYRLLTAICEGLFSRRGRTALIWVSSGVKLMQDGPYRALIFAARNRPSQGAYSPDQRILNEQERLHAAANSSNVSIYAVDPGLISDSRNLALDGEVASAAASRMLRTPEFTQSFDALGDSLREASAATGGRAFIRATDLGAALDQIDELSSRFYLLTYRRPRNESDGEYHEIRVEVARPRVRVDARKGYTDIPFEQRLHRSIDAALQLPGIANDFAMRIDAFALRRPQVASVLVAGAAQVTRDGAFENLGELAASAASATDWHVVVLRGTDVIEEFHWTASGPRAATGSPPAALRQVDETFFQHEFQLDAGVTYDIRVAVVDRVTGQIAAEQITVDLVAPSDDWHASDVLLVAREPNGMGYPVVGGEVFVDQEVTAYLEIYGGSEPTLMGAVHLAATAGPGDPHSVMPAVPMDREDAGIARGTLPLPVLSPGEYVLEIVAVDALPGKEKTWQLPITVSER